MWRGGQRERVDESLMRRKDVLCVSICKVLSPGTPKGCLIFQLRQKKKINIESSLCVGGRHQTRNQSGWKTRIRRGDLSSSSTFVCGLALLMRKSTAWIVQWCVNGNEKLINIHAQMWTRTQHPREVGTSQLFTKKRFAFDLEAAFVVVGGDQTKGNKNTFIDFPAAHPSAGFKLLSKFFFLWKLSFKYANFSICESMIFSEQKKGERPGILVVKLAHLQHTINSLLFRGRRKKVRGWVSFHQTGT